MSEPVVDPIVEYDEFGLFHENAAEYDLAFHGPPVVRREDVELDDGRHVSTLVWGEGDPELVLIHGGAQNAHTWDTVAMALGRPLLAVDLPGHGHSAWRDDGAYDPVNLAADVAVVVEALAPRAQLVVGMSLGGLTAMVLAARRPELVPALALVDITPGVNRQKAKAVIDFVSGPQSFASFQELLDRTMEHNPTRSESSLRRGILHNARQLDDGSWVWRYDRRGHARSSTDESGGEDQGGEGAGSDETATGIPGDVVVDGAGDPAQSPLWDDFSAVVAPILLVRGGVSPVVDDDDVAEARRRQPVIDVEVIDGAGHSVQGDRPVELAALLATRLRPV